MTKTNVAETLDRELAEALDRFVASRPLDSRSEAMETALAEKVIRRARTLLAGDAPAANGLFSDGFESGQ